MKKQVSDIINKDVIKQINGVYERGGSKTEVAHIIAKHTGLGKTQCKYWARELFNLKFQGNTEVVKDELTKTGKQISTSTFSGDECEVKISDPNIKNLQDVVNEGLIDLNEWEVQEYSVNKWLVAVHDADGKLINKPAAQLKINLKRRQTIIVDKLVEMFREGVKRHLPKKFNITKSKRENGLLYVPSCFDLHAGKMAWGQETGHADYDIKLACSAFRDALECLMARVEARDVDRVLLPIGNDLFNSDTPFNTTTLGTRQDEDSRWPKSFRIVTEMLCSEIEKIASQIPVDVLIVSGNHDYTKTWYAGEFLRAWFEKHTNVSIANEPTQRKYYSRGKVLIGYTHGNEEKVDKLPLIMATERPKEWSECICREWHLGHKHHASVMEISGVNVRVIPSMCPPDSWHSSKGYIGNKTAAIAFLYDTVNGRLLAQNYYHS